MVSRTSWRAKLLLVFVSVAVGLGLAELGLRLTGFSRPYFYTYDQDLGWMLRPGVSGWFRKEGEAYIQVNSAGMRDDREYLTTKPKDTIRIAILGDSFAEALQVPVAQTFWSVLGRDLGHCQPLSGRRIEVLNFGVSNYGTAQELVMLRDRVWMYSPDLVLLAFTPANDVRNNSRALEQDELRPYFVFQNGALVADMSFRDSPTFRQKQTLLNRTIYSLINHSRLLQLVNGIRDDIETRRKAAAIRTENQNGNQLRNQIQSAITNRAGDVGIEDQAYMEPKDPEWNEAWRVTEALLAQMNNEVNEHGAKFLVVTVTGGPQVTPDAAARQAFMSRLKTQDLFYVERRIEAVGKREHFPVLTLAPVFVKYASDHQTALHGFGAQLNLGHWNAEGHRLAGETIAETLCQMLMSRG